MKLLYLGNSRTTSAPEVVPPPWSPTSLPGLVAWYAADDLSWITAAAGKVSQWADKSGNGYHLTQATGTKQPSTGTNTQNALNVVRFDGVDDALNNTSTTALGSNLVTIYAVVYVTGGADFHSQLIYCGASNITAGLGVSYTGQVSFSADYGSAFIGTASILGAAHQITLKGGQPLTIYKDAVVDSTGGAGAAGAEAGAHVSYTGYSAAGPLLWIAEAFYTNVNNTDTDRGKAETYLKTKWGTP